MNKHALKDAQEVAEGMLAHAKEFCRAQSIPAKHRLEYMKLLIEASTRNYVAIAQREALREIADAASDIAHAIAFAAAEDEEALRKLEDGSYNFAEVARRMMR